MATTVQQLADDALLQIMVAGSEAPLAADDMADFIYSLNRYMASLVAIGINLGFSEVSSASDQLTVPDGAIDGLTSNMAIKLAPKYGGVVTPELRMDAKDGMETLRVLGQSIPQSAYPTTLPVGSGNEWSWGPNYYDGFEP